MQAIHDLPSVPCFLVIHLMSQRDQNTSLNVEAHEKGRKKLLDLPHRGHNHNSCSCRSID